MLTIDCEAFGAMPIRPILMRLNRGERIGFAEGGRLTFTIAREGHLVIMRKPSGAKMASGLSFAEVWGAHGPQRYWRL